MTDVEGTSGPLDVATLEVLARRAADHPLVQRWTFRPDALSPRHLELGVDARQYPASVDAVRIDVRWFEGGDYSFHYVESEDDEHWQCRWHRYPKPEAPRAHFHPPPDAAVDVEESSFDVEHHLGVCFAVLDWIEARVEALHDE